jgi:hypothetical protein
MILLRSDKLYRNKSTRNFCPVCSFLSAQTFHFCSLFWFCLPTVLVFP